MWEAEPPPPAHPLLQFDNVHRKPAHRRGDARVPGHDARMAAEQLLDILDGKRPPRLINPEVWPAYCDRFFRLFGFHPG